MIGWSTGWQTKRYMVLWVGKLHAHTHKEYTVIEIPCCIEPTVKSGIPEFHAEFLSKMFSTVCAWSTHPLNSYLGHFKSYMIVELLHNSTSEMRSKGWHAVLVCDQPANLKICFSLLQSWSRCHNSSKCVYVIVRCGLFTLLRACNPWTTASLMKEVCHNVTIKPILQPLSGEILHPHSAIVDDNARSDVRAKGFWDCRQQHAYFDVKVFNPVAATYRNKFLQSCYRRLEAGKRREYQDRILHGPFRPSSSPPLVAWVPLPLLSFED